jgi:hypothetical protein
VDSVLNDTKTQKMQFTCWRSAHDFFLGEPSYNFMYHRVPCSQKLAAAPTAQDFPEYRTNWPRVRWCVGVVWCG